MSTREETVAKLKAKLDEWNAEIDELEAKARWAKAATAGQYHNRIASLKARQEEASAKLREIQTASEKAWQALAAGAEAVWGRLATTVKETKRAFQEGMRGE